MTSKPYILTLCLPVSELSEYRIRSLLGQRFRLGKVRARGSHGNACYAQVNIQENSSYVVAVRALHKLIINSVLVILRSSNKC